MTREMFYLLSVLVAALVGFLAGWRSRGRRAPSIPVARETDACGGEYGRDFCDQGGTCDSHSPWRRA